MEDYDFNKVVGLMNFGNTCFMNSALQLLFSCPLLVKLFVISSFQDEHLIKYQQTFKDYFLKDTTSLGPKILFNRYKDIHGDYQGYTQEDAHEYLTFIIDDLNTLIMKTSDDKLFKIFEKMVVTQMATAVTCLHCGFFLSKKMPENILSLSIDNHNTLLECLDNLLKEEKLVDCNQWECDKCKCKRDAEKKIVITRFPQYLFISLNRYKYNNGFVEKDNRNIDIPFSWSYKDNTYVIHGLVCHVGDHRGGHYFSFINRNDKWYFVNDRQIKETSWDEIKNVFNLVYIIMFSKI